MNGLSEENWFCADGVAKDINVPDKEGRGSGMIDIRTIDGLWCDDITFCQEHCDWRDCPRNQCNIRNHNIPHSFSVDIPKDCPKQQVTGKLRMR